MRQDIEHFTPANRDEWRKWLTLHHKEKDAIWLVFYKKNSPTPNLSWSEAVDEALCFGWIDSVKKTIDGNSYKQHFGKRNPKSNWSKINKDKVERLTQLNLMCEAGSKAIETAKQNGSWTILDSVENLEIPKDLDDAFSANHPTKDYFLGLSKSLKKGLLYYVISAKRNETRVKRINTIIEHALNKTVPKQFRN